jgi:hypothetical protein
MAELSSTYKSSNNLIPLKLGRHHLRDLIFYEGVHYPYVEVEVHKPDPYPSSSLVVGIWGSAYTMREPSNEEEKEKEKWENIANELGEKIALFPKQLTFAKIRSLA